MFSFLRRRKRNPDFSRLRVFMAGNMNNYPFLMGRALIELGHEVVLCTVRDELLHRPQSLLEAAQSLPWVRDMSHLSEEADYIHSSTRLNELIEIAASCDVALLNDLTLGMAHRLDCPHVAFTTGSDISYYACLDMPAIRMQAWDPTYRRSADGRKLERVYQESAARQREGIASALFCTTMNRGSAPDSDAILDQLGVLDPARLALPISNVDHLTFDPPKMRDEPLKILMGSRLNFSDVSEPGRGMLDNKGADVLLRGFAQFVAAGGRAELRLPIKGRDLERARQCILQWGLESHVQWLPEMPLLSFYDEIRRADIVCDQFGTSIPSMLAWDTLAIGRPLVGNLRHDIFTPAYGTPIPGMHCVDAEAVADALRLLTDYRLRLDLAENGRHFAERHYSARMLAEELVIRIRESLLQASF